MSEQQAGQASGESGSLDAESAAPHSSEAQREPVAASVQESVQESANVDSPALAPEQGPAAETAKVGAPKADAPNLGAPRQTRRTRPARS